MAIPTVPTQVYCGEADETCTPKTTVKRGKAPVVTATSGDCDRDLVSDEYPAVMQAFSDSVTELRSGSAALPFKLPLMKEQTGGSMRTIVTKLADGTIIAWKPVRACFKRKLMVESDGSIQAEIDTNSAIFEYSCVGDIADATHIAMAAEFTDCDGQTRFRMRFVEKAGFLDELLAGATEITFSGDINCANIIASGDITVGGTLTADEFQIGGGATITNVLHATDTKTWGPIALGDIDSITISVPGAEIGDSVLVGWQFGLRLGWCMVNPHVSSADNVTVSVLNATGATTALAAMSMSVTVFKF